MRLKIISIVLTLIVIVSIGSTALASPHKVNMNIVDGQIRDVLTALADIGDVNLVVDDSVSGNITIQLRDVTFETALNMVTKTKGLIYHKYENVLIVGTSDQIGRGFGNVHIFQLKYINPDAIRDTALSILFGEKKGEKRVEEKQGLEQLSSTSKNNITSKSNLDSQQKSSQKSTELDRLTIDYATNSLILYGTAQEAAKIQELLNQLDIPYQQVTLEAEVVALSKENAKNLGIEWSWEATPQWPEVETDEDGKVTETRESHKGTIKFGRSPGGVPYEFYYQAQINALVSNGNAKILAKPKITTINGKPAQILIGDRIPVLVESIEDGKTKTTIEYIETGIKLQYIPRINTDGQITATVRTEVSSPALVTEMKAYRITTREAETTVRLKDGETMVIGGLIGAMDNEARKAVPFLSDLPILGGLFKNINKSKTDTEVVIFLTPRIVK